MCPQSEFLGKKFKESDVTKTESTNMTQFTSLQFTTASFLRLALQTIGRGVET
jgi:hypothetical protein